MLITVLLFGGTAAFLDRTKCLPARLCAFVSLSCLALLCTANFISLELSVSTASYCVAM